MNEMYRSNNGAGPQEARVVRIRNGIAFMERRKIGSTRWGHEFRLTTLFLLSPACGWKKEKARA